MKKVKKKIKRVFIYNFSPSEIFPHTHIHTHNKILFKDLYLNDTDSYVCRIRHCLRR